MDPLQRESIAVAPGRCSEPAVRVGPSCYRAPVTLSVLIPMLNEQDQISSAISSASAPGVEVVVVDGGSADASCERAAAAGARVIAWEGGEPGRARQLALGVPKTRGDVILFLHADTRLPAGFETAVRDAMADPGTVAGAFGFRLDGRGVGLRLIEFGVRLRVALFRMPYGDQALFVRRSALDAIGGIPQAAIMEDLDLVRSLRRRGRLVRVAAPVVTSARRYRSGGVLRTMARNWLAAAAWSLGIDRDRIAAWYRR